MCFVDGENFTIRAQNFAKSEGFNLDEGPDYQKDIFAWFPRLRTLDVILYGRSYGSYSRPVRTYYYTSVVGDENTIKTVRESIWNLGFHPEVFKKSKKQEKAKGVDIALAKDFLSNAFRDNYDVAFLFAGDGDYVPLVEEAKRIGKTVCVVFFSSQGLSNSLKLAADHFLCIEQAFSHAWTKKEL